MGAHLALEDFNRGCDFDGVRHIERKYPPTGHQQSSGNIDHLGSTLFLPGNGSRLNLQSVL
jgi:hypothetical protein